MEEAKTVAVVLGKQERQIIDRIRRKHYTMNQSEIVRWLINEGGKNLLGKKEDKKE